RTPPSFYKDQFQSELVFFVQVEGTFTCLIKDRGFILCPQAACEILGYKEKKSLSHKPLSVKKQ
ncbi:hypothetical protein P9B49_19295, partial [Bacillus safensis]|uniref:hypothetical protein n=1 Tax=Bacillus safensis TaxID=561879 RepID=UPI002DBDAAF0